MQCRAQHSAVVASRETPPAYKSKPAEQIHTMRLDSSGAPLGAPADQAESAVPN